MENAAIGDLIVEWPGLFFLRERVLQIEHDHAAAREGDFHTPIKRGPEELAHVSGLEIPR